MSEQGGCDHPGIEHGTFSYTWPCPRCGVCRFIGHGPLCGKCYDETAMIEDRIARVADWYATRLSAEAPR